MDREQLLSSESTIPSSPPPAIFSDEPQHASSASSSPPGFPWEKQTPPNDTLKPLLAQAKSAFSLLGKRKALEPVSDNVRPSKKAATTSTKNTSKPLTQMQMSLGQEVQKKCKTCGMEYIASSAEDRKLHDKYHKQNTEGYDVGKDFVQKARKYTTFKGARVGDAICAVDCFDKPARRRRGQAVLEVVQRELGAVDIPENEIWDSRYGDALANGDPKFRTYLYIRGSKCIGVLLREKIKEAQSVQEPVLPASTLLDLVRSEDGGGVASLSALKSRQQAEAERLSLLAKQPITLANHAVQAQVGISRIWTSPTCRGQHIATALLDTAFQDHNERVQRDQDGRIRASSECDARGISRELQDQVDALMPMMEKLESKNAVAFSQPTEAGVRLARRWFGKMFGWAVYVD